MQVLFLLFFIFLDFFFELVYNVEKAAHLQGFSRIRRNRFFVFFFPSSVWLLIFSLFSSIVNYDYTNTNVFPAQDLSEVQSEIIDLSFPGNKQQKNHHPRSSQSAKTVI